ncbi:7353_t:CDS:1, partial [Cetraspora pellucida]
MSQNNDTNIIAIFHVLLPFDTDSYKPVVVGNCEALGKWETPKVYLRRISNSALWVSDPVNIPIDLNVEYKYCLVASRAFPKFFTPQLNFEGGRFSNRQMELRGNVYDVWIDSDKFKSIHPVNENYELINYIYESIKSPDNLKDGIMECQYILSKY